MTELTEFFAAWAQTFNNRDWDSHCALYEDDIRFAVPPGPTILNGRSELRKALEGFTTRFADIQLSLKNFVADENHVAAEWEEVGTEAETGERAVFKFCGMFKFRDGVIATVSRYGGRET